MIPKRLKSYALAAGIGLAGLLGANHAKAAEPTQNIEYKIDWLEEALKTKAPDNPAELLTPKQTNKNGLEWLIVGSEIGASVLATIFIHETGHVIVADLLGADITGFKPYPHKIENRFVGGAVKFKPNDATQKWKQIGIYGGGMAATRITSEAIDELMDQYHMHPRIEQGLAALYFMNRFESTKYIVREAIPCWMGKPRDFSDPQRIINQITNLKKRKKKPNERKLTSQRKSTMEEKAIYGLGVNLLIFDTIMDIDEIKTNWNRLWMNHPEKSEKSLYDIDLKVIDDGVYGTITYEF